MQSSRAILVHNTNDYFVGPIFKSAFKYAAENDIDIVGADYDLSQYDAIVAIVNRPEKITRMKTSARIGWWMNDLRAPYEMGEPQHKIDAVFLCNTELQKNYERAYNAPVYHVPQCGIDEQEIKGRKINWDVVFIGNFISNRFHRNRLDYITALTGAGYDVKIISGSKFTKDSKYIYRNTPFCLSISPEAAGYTSNRTYNILSSGGFCLIKAFPGIENLFENHKHVVWFNNTHELLENVEYYYSNPEEYEQIRENGHQLYLNNHTAGHRLEYMLSILESL